MLRSFFRGPRCPLLPTKPIGLSTVWRRSGGFTFLELVVVIAIMGIMMAVTLPRFSSSLSKATLGGTARALAGTIAYLRNAAAKEGRSYFLNIDLNNHQYWVTIINEEADLTLIDLQESDVLDDEIYAEVSDAFVARTRLQKKVAFAQVMLEDGTRVSDGLVTIEFRPDGTADEVAIHLTNPKERFYTVYLERYNGQAKVYKGVFLPEPLPVLTERVPPTRPEDAL
jgi:prepilin-type N-terminal cleavage/methylation domain-containing protein